MTIPGEIVGPRPGQDQGVLGAGHDGEGAGEEECDRRLPTRYGVIHQWGFRLDDVGRETCAVDRAEAQEVVPERPRELVHV